MALATGTRLGSYEVTAQIGVGGMGEVYRATDTKLKRQVAIKVLPESVSADPERLARFQREAEVLAALNHPNIAGIYGAEDADGSKALVMELVEGPTLAERIAEGPLPVDDALAIARQIADALEAAHGRGIIHRDLKPANIKVREDGTVKVLDFGLAKALSQDPGPSTQDLTQSPTITTPAMTQMGMILGTAAYMSPEQARGRPVDKRADIWAFGCVLYEMLTGRRAFEGEDVSLTLAAVLRADVNFDALPTETPARVRQVLAVCLQRDPRQRAHDIADVRLALDGAFETTTGAPSERIAAPPLQVWQRPAGVVAIGVATALLAGLVVWGTTRGATVPANPIRFAIVPPVSAPLDLASGTQTLAVSPDGTRIVYRSQNGNPDDGQARLSVRPIDQLDVTPLRGTEGASTPFVSPDGEWVGFYVPGEDELKKISILGGPPVSLTRPPAGVHGASWGADDQIIFGTFGAGLFRVPAGGGVAEALTTPDTGQGETSHFSPFIIAGRSAVLFATGAGSRSLSTVELAVLDLATGSVTRLGIAGLAPHYTATGHLVYAVEDGSLRAVTFDAASLTVTGNPVPLVEGIAVRSSGAADFSLSDAGGLVYASGGPWQGARTLVWVDRQGHEEPIGAPANPYYYPRLSPDGGRLALDARGDEDGIWIWNFAGETLTRLILGDGNYHYPVWTPDGERIAYIDNRSEDILWKAANNTGAPSALAEAAGSGGPGGPSPYFFTPDGTALVHRDQEHPETDDDLVMVSITDDAPAPWRLNGHFRERNAELSPDGRWMAYQSDESGTFEIYVRPFPQVDADQVQVSNNGGSYPLWSRDGRELFYIEPGAVSELISVSFDTGGTDRRFIVRGREVVLEWPYFQATEGRNYEVSPDGQRFIAIKASEDLGQLPTITVVLNWFAELTRRVPVD